MNQKLIAFNLKQRKPLTTPELRAGDVIKIFRKIKEGGKERLQAFQGTVIAIKGGQSSSQTITVRKVSFGVGVELVLPLSSPQIEKIEFIKRTRARRAKLYYVRDKSVKVLRKKLKEIAVKGGLVPEAQEKTSAAIEEAEGVAETTEKAEA
ncbi:MAG: 50S ribosomal protein L19 [Candidatus Moranbacteria bacterium RIFCSPHIGHO2_12_FULL_54_9]|nr:MAG: 50S ribosomal protein L19 [Candidatus Moranbacteria bacterium RIFCSPHIGHO2_01_FULL_54_31]OGI24741.1 MAG: 50S ribosomal protein L19 [Candidatus Moranbacteria bacterium RIFCSPHIGHO2_12_FULL_54_9]